MSIKTVTVNSLPLAQFLIKKQPINSNNFSMVGLYGPNVPIPLLRADQGETKGIMWLTRFFRDRFAPNDPNVHNAANTKWFLVLAVW